jgi:hypothetical protein
LNNNTQADIIKTVVKSIIEGNSPTETRENAVVNAPANEKSEAVVIANSFTDTFAKLM